VEQLTCTFNFRARYYKLGRIDDSTKQVWWVLHGYGQLAQYFVQKFKPLSEKGICIVAPEGLSKFYLAGNAGRIGATWMTRENRIVEIENYTNYLDSILAIERPPSHVKTTLLGFSQGAATAVRWVMNGKLEFDRLVLWAGLFPPDMDFDKGTHLLQNKEVIEVLGKHDEFITKEKIAEMYDLNTRLQLNPTIIEFEGKHELDAGVIEKIAFG
jgi:predicted esterase